MTLKPYTGKDYILRLQYGNRLLVYYDMI